MTDNIEEFEVNDLKNDLTENDTKAVIELRTTSMAIIESDKFCHLIIDRYGKMDDEIDIR